MAGAISWHKPGLKMTPLKEAKCEQTNMEGIHSEDRFMVGATHRPALEPGLKIARF